MSDHQWGVEPTADHVAIQDGDRMVCTHCGKDLGLFDMLTELERATKKAREEE